MPSVASIDRRRAARLAARGAFLSCLGVALGWGLLVPALSVDDSPSYTEPARSFAEGRGLALSAGQPMVSRLPLYPVALGLAIRLFGDGGILPGALNAAFHVLSVLVVRRVLPRGPLVDLISAWALVWPPLLTPTGLVLQEPLLGLTLAVAFVAGFRLLEAPSAARALAFGLACGVSALAKTTVLPACLVVVLLSLGAGARLRALGRALIVAAGVALVVLPWGVRNLQAVGRFQIANANGGEALLGGSVSSVVESWPQMPELVAARARWEALERRRYPVFDDYLYEVALERIAADPLGYLRLSLGRVVRFMLPARHWFVAAGLSQVGTVSPAYLAGALFQAVLFGGAAWIAIAAVRLGRATPALVAPAFVFSHQALYAATHASPRYGATVGPILFAALALVLARPENGTAGTGR